MKVKQTIFMDLAQLMDEFVEIIHTNYDAIEEGFDIPGLLREIQFFKDFCDHVEVIEGIQDEHKSSNVIQKEKAVIEAAKEVRKAVGPGFINLIPVQTFTVLMACIDALEGAG